MTSEYIKNDYNFFLYSPQLICMFLYMFPSSWPCFNVLLYYICKPGSYPLKRKKFEIPSFQVHNSVVSGIFEVVQLSLLSNSETLSLSPKRNLESINTHPTIFSSLVHWPTTDLLSVSPHPLLSKDKTHEAPINYNLEQRSATVSSCSGCVACGILVLSQELNPCPQQ